MSFKGAFAALLLALCLLPVLYAPAGATGGAPADSAVLTDAAHPDDPAQQRVEPLIPPAAGALGLILLLSLGAVVSRRRKGQEELGYDQLWPDGQQIQDPYSRLAGTGKRKNRR